VASSTNDFYVTCSCAAAVTLTCYYQYRFGDNKFVKQKALPTIEKLLAYLAKLERYQRKHPAMITRIRSHNMPTAAQQVEGRGQAMEMHNLGVAVLAAAHDLMEADRARFQCGNFSARPEVQHEKWLGFAPEDWSRRPRADWGLCEPEAV
jgi:hypothetical protein